MASAILEGIKVLDLTRVLAGPWCTQSLADMGATVYKIERPGVGDEIRHSPPFVSKAGATTRGDSTSYLCVNRGKRSLTIDISKPEGQALVRELARKCDVLVENYKVGDLARYGLDYASLSADNPGLVYCSITGYGQTGPLSALPGYDPVFQAICGIMSTCGIPDGKPGAGPMRSTVPFIDVMTGMISTTAVLGALYHRQATGEGQYLDIALLDVALAATVHHAQTYLSTGKVPGRLGNGSPLFAPSNCFGCSDGEILIQIGNDVQWQRLCQCLEKQDWLEDERFATNASRMKHVQLLDVALTEVTRHWKKQALADRLSEAGVPCGPVNSLAEAMDNPQVRHRGIRTVVNHPEHGPIEQVRNPLVFSKTPVTHRPAPAFGADTESVLHAELGLTPDAVAALRQLKIV